MRTTMVKAHPRRLPQKDPTYISKHEQLRAEVAAMARVNEFRDEIGYKRRPSENETLFGLAVRKLDEFLAEKGIL